MRLRVTLFMTAIRSFARRGLAHDVDWERIPSGEELGWFSEHVCHTQVLAIDSSQIALADVTQVSN